MRSTVLLLVGFALLVAGVVVLVVGVPGGVLLGPVLLVAGALVKVGGLLLDAEPPTGAPGGRSVTTIGGAAAERPRPGVPAGRASLRHRRRTVATPSARAGAGRPDRHRQAS